MSSPTPAEPLPDPCADGHTIQEMTDNNGKVILRKCTVCNKSFPREDVVE